MSRTLCRSRQEELVKHGLMKCVEREAEIAQLFRVPDGEPPADGLVQQAEVDQVKPDADYQVFVFRGPGVRAGCSSP